MKFELRCCGRKNPIGVDKNHIRLNFAADGGQAIVSYELQITSVPKNFKSGSICDCDLKLPDMWSFKGAPRDGYLLWLEPSLLRSRTRYYWRVAAVTGEGTIYSEIASFETGIDSWAGDWIGGQERDSTEMSDPEQEFGSDKAVQNFRREFRVQGDIGQARLYLCGLGYFNATLNGTSLDEAWYKPQMTDYEPRIHRENGTLYENSGHRVTYYTYDVTAYLKQGTNILSVDVANGYYCNTDKLEFEPNFSFGSPKLIYELYVTENGTERRIISDPETKVCTTSRESSLYIGDQVDYTKTIGAYHSCERMQSPMGKPVSPQCPDDRVEQVLFPQKVWSFAGGAIYDFGVNHTGGLRFTADAGADGCKLHIRYAEVLDEDGNPNYETSAWHELIQEDGRRMDVYQENSYILKKGRNEITPLFSWYCYRYIWVEITGDVQISNMQSLFIHMDLEKDGHFLCSDDTLNRINEMFLQTLFCNLHSGLLTDCPHREKRPYTGDGNLVMKASLYNLNSLSFYYKWLEDLLDAQTPEGLIPNTAPNLGGGGGYAWGNAICFVTKYLYCATGDRRIARKGYCAIKKWLSFYEANRDEDYIIRSNGHAWMLGDWLAPDTVVSDVYYISTVCYLMAVDTALFLAEQLESEQRHPKMPESECLEEQRYREQQLQLRELKEHIKEGINKIFFHPEIPAYGNGVQGENVLALAVGIVPEQQEEALRKKVEHHYRRETDYHLDTGIVLTPLLIEYLTDNGYQDIAYRIMTVQTYPSYYMLMEGDTTFSEHWSKRWPDFYFGDGNSRLIKGGGELSHCHPMYGSVVSWLYERVAGLDLSLLYQQKVQISPYFTDCLSWAKADKVTPYGKVSVEWESTGSGLYLKVVIPENLIGICSFPSRFKVLRCRSAGETYHAGENGYFRFEIPSGKWDFEAISH